MMGSRIGTPPDGQLGDLRVDQSKELGQQSTKRRKPHRVPALVPQERGDALPLSYAQERLWFLDQLGLVGPAYNVPSSLRLAGKLNVAALQRSLTETIRRHESLRTRFVSVEGRPIQVIGPPGTLVLQVEDLTG